MTTHIAHSSPDERQEFLVDDCPRCAEYVEDNGIHFDEHRFRLFWRKMVAVEFDDLGGYSSKADKELGRRLYLVAARSPAGVRLRPAPTHAGWMVMRVVFTVDVPDDFVVERAAQFSADVEEDEAATAREYFEGRVRDIAGDELPIAFYGWPIEVDVQVEA